MVYNHVHVVYAVLYVRREKVHLLALFGNCYANLHRLSPMAHVFASRVVWNGNVKHASAVGAKS